MLRVESPPDELLEESIGGTIPEPLSPRFPVPPGLSPDGLLLSWGRFDPKGLLGLGMIVVVVGCVPSTVLPIAGAPVVDCGVSKGTMID